MPCEALGTTPGVQLLDVIAVTGGVGEGDEVIAEGDLRARREVAERAADG